MTTDDLRTRAREVADGVLEAAIQEYSPNDDWTEYPNDYMQEAFAAGAVWHAAQQPSREVYSVQYWEDGDGFHSGWVAGNGYFTCSRSDAEEQLEYDRGRHSTVRFRLAVAEITDWRDVPTDGADR